MPERLLATRATNRRTSGPLTFASVLQGWGGRKNGRVAIEAFAQFRREHPDSRFVMFGYGHGPGGDAERWALARGMPDGIEFVGLLPYADLIARLAREIDVLVHPCARGGKPKWHCWRRWHSASLSSHGEDSGGTRWTLDEGRAGMLVDITDPAAVAQAMNELARPHEREGWAQRGLDFARRQFHIRHVADAYEGVYAELLQRR